MSKKSKFIETNPDIKSEVLLIPNMLNPWKSIIETKKFYLDAPKSKRTKKTEINDVKNFNFYLYNDYILFYSLGSCSHVL